MSTIQSKHALSTQIERCFISSSSERSTDPASVTDTSSDSSANSIQQFQYPSPGDRIYVRAIGTYSRKSIQCPSTFEAFQQQICKSYEWPIEDAPNVRVYMADIGGQINERNYKLLEEGDKVDVFRGSPLFTNRRTKYSTTSSPSSSPIPSSLKISSSHMPHNVSVKKHLSSFILPRRFNDTNRISSILSSIDVDSIPIVRHVTLRSPVNEHQQHYTRGESKEYINVSIESTDGHQLQFRVNVDVLLYSLASMYALRSSCTSDVVNLRYNGVTLPLYRTSRQVGLPSNAKLTAHANQVHGNSLVYFYTPSSISVTCELSLCPKWQLVGVLPQRDITNCIETNWTLTTSPDNTGVIFDCATKGIYRYLHYEALSKEYQRVDHYYLDATNLNSVVGPLFTFDEPGAFCVSKEDIEQFLTSVLGDMGLTDTEANDILNVWLPLVCNNPYTLINFALDTEYHRATNFQITPPPDTIIRVILSFKRRDEWMECTGVLPSPVSSIRSGFTVVEVLAVDLDAEHTPTETVAMV